MNYIDIYIGWLLSSFSIIMFFLVAMEKKFTTGKTVILLEGISVVCITLKLYLYIMMQEKAFNLTIFPFFFCYLIGVHLCFKGTLSKKLLYLLIHHVIGCGCEMITVSLVCLSFQIEQKQLFNQQIYSYVITFEVLLVTMVLYMAAVCLRSFETKHNLKREWYFVILPIGVLLTSLSIMLHVIKGSVIVSWGNIIETSLIMGFMMAIPMIMSETAEMEAMEEKLKECQWQYEKEIIHYELLEVKQKELRKIEHDFNNHLTTVIALVEKGEEREAVNLLYEIRRQFL